MSNRHTRVSLEGVPEEEGHLEEGGATVICLLQLLVIANKLIFVSFTFSHESRAKQLVEYFLPRNIRN